MRTTVTIDDHLLAEAKALAARTNRSLGAVVDEALRDTFSQRAARSGPVVLPSHGRGGLRPGLNLDDRAAIADALGENDADAAL